MSGHAAEPEFIFSRIIMDGAVSIRTITTNNNISSFLQRDEEEEEEEEEEECVFLWGNCSILSSPLSPAGSEGNGRLKRRKRGQREGEEERRRASEQRCTSSNGASGGRSTDGPRHTEGRF
ncbi:Hypothetical predicted protein [Xyrichtys novacula]|uniref:Uncharacterized protein n=1 Tax=Xyrichtys novacula TaxID=13765 RepID=A0AAV1EZZ1_XYRNO|nr:Hypothetical predicted protein [Xyrichtys novacula]